MKIAPALPRDRRVPRPVAQAAQSSCAQRLAAQGHRSARRTAAPWSGSKERRPSSSTPGSERIQTVESGPAHTPACPFFGKASTNERRRRPVLSGRQRLLTFPHHIERTSLRARRRRATPHAASPSITTLPGAGMALIVSCGGFADSRDPNWRSLKGPPDTFWMYRP